MAVGSVSLSTPTTPHGIRVWQALPAPETSGKQPGDCKGGKWSNRLEERNFF